MMNNPISIARFFGAISYFSFILLLTSTDGITGAKIKPAIQLATSYRQGLDIRQFWISEKLDGVRGYWTAKQLLSRQGNPLMAPPWFTAGFPNVALDGELWIARGQFERVSGTVRQHQPDHQRWLAVRFMLFDLPDSGEPFSVRVEQMKTLVAEVNSPYLAMIPQRRLSDESQLNAWLDQVVAGGGEGLMLHHGDAIYQSRRSHNVMKLKKYQDAEAVVLSYLPGKGKYQGLMGAMLVRDAHGVEFKIGSGFSDAQRRHPPPLGAVITFKYYGKTVNNVPRFASFMRLRE